ncbi:MAG: nucleotide sugar dehydrogenase, partial [Verrucomicrobiota bacterium]
PEKIRTLESRETYIAHIPPSQIAEIYSSGNFSATTDFSKVESCDGVILCVPTPLNKYREPDLSYVLKTAASIAPHLKSGTLICLESTTYPGTTENDLRQVLEDGSGKIAGKDFHLAYSPEREDPSNPDSKVERIPKLVGGFTPECLRKAIDIYSRAIEHLVPVDSCKIAEAAKLLENIFRSVNIALVNELKVVYDAMGIDIWKVIEAAKTKPFGFMPFYPGPGLGGHCIPIDPFYLTWKAREFGQHTRFIELAGEINTSMPQYVIDVCMRALNVEGKAVKGAHILILGLAYKPNVDDDRESPTYTLIEKLEALGATVDYNDPYIDKISMTREHAQLAGRQSVPVSDDFDLLIVATNHEVYSDRDYSGFKCPIVDTRNSIKNPPELYYKA